MADKKLIVVVEGTAAMGPFWQSVVSDYLEKIIRFNSLSPIDFTSISVLTFLEYLFLMYWVLRAFFTCKIGQFVVDLIVNLGMPLMVQKIIFRFLKFQKLWFLFRNFGFCFGRAVLRGVFQFHVPIGQLELHSPIPKSKISANQTKPCVYVIIGV